MKQIQDLTQLGLNITEKEFRDINALSYSVLSTMDREGPAAVGKEVEMTEPLIHGTLVDSMMDGTYNANDYYITAGVSIGDGIKGAVDALLSHLESLTDVIDVDLSSWKTELIHVLETQNIDYYAKKDADWVSEKIMKDEVAKAYFKDVISAKGKTVITLPFLQNAEKSVMILRNHEFTKDIFKNYKTPIQAVYQFKYEFVVKGHKFKGMLDRLIIDHEKKTIQPYDLKTGGKPAKEFENSFFYWRYDLQALLYHIICLRIQKLYYPDYEIKDFKFVYIGRFEHKPLIWNVPHNLLLHIVDGYTRNGKTYKGLIPLIKDYDWYASNSFKVDYPEKVYSNKGVIEINDFNIISVKENDKNRKK